jgi:SH3 domain-containing YSC84-like protein 1
MKRLLTMALVAGMGLGLTAQAQNPPQSSDQAPTTSHEENVKDNLEAAKEADRLDKAAAVLESLEGTPDKGVPDEIAKGANCVAIVPGLKKGAIGVGGQYGQGFAVCRVGQGQTGRHWSAPAPIRMAGGSWGLQLGGSSTDIVMMVMNEKGMQDLLNAKFKIGGDAGAAAGPVGRHAQAGVDWKLDSELLTYSRSKGLFAGISLDGTEVSQNDDSTRALYGHVIPFRTILDGQTPTPAKARRFEAALHKYFDRVATDKGGKGGK